MMSITYCSRVDQTSGQCPVSVNDRLSDDMAGPVLLSDCNSREPTRSTCNCHHRCPLSGLLRNSTGFMPVHPIWSSSYFCHHHESHCPHNECRLPLCNLSGHTEKCPNNS